MSNTEGIRDTLIERAGLTTEKVEAAKKKPPLDVSFGLIVEVLKDIQHAKSMLYGDYIYATRDDPEGYRLIQHFCDIKRKFIRANNFIKERTLAEFNPTSDLNDLIDTYADLAVYSVFGIDLIQTLIEIKKMKEKEEDEHDRRDNQLQ